jgi:thymidylate synthase (FAD)
MKSNEKQPVVDLISYPNNIKGIIYTACKTCTSDELPAEIFNKANLDCDDFEEQDCVYESEPEYFDSACTTEHCPLDKTRTKNLKLIEKVMSSNHMSTVEHVNFVFSISGISRSCAQQLLRHRHLSASMKSQRYVTETEQFEYITPESIENKLSKSESPINNRGEKFYPLATKYKYLMGSIQDFYNEMIEVGVPVEDARYILPNAATTSLVITCNLRELIHIANERLCTNSQYEIRKLINIICDLVIEKEPWLSTYLKPKCKKQGFCAEIKCCGRSIRKGVSI